MTSSWRDLPIGKYLAALASGSPTPGGGSAASLSGALAAALGRMVIAVAQEKEPSAERAGLGARLRELEEGFLALAEDDELAFAEVMEALRVPRDAAGRGDRLQAALERAARVPLRAADAGVRVLRSLEEAEPHASRSIVSDIGVASHLALAAIQSSLLNVAVNVRSIKDPTVAARLLTQIEEFRRAAQAAHANVVARVDARLAPKSP